MIINSRHLPGRPTDLKFPYSTRGRICLFPANPKRGQQGKNHGLLKLLRNFFYTVLNTTILEFTDIILNAKYINFQFINYFFNIHNRINQFNKFIISFSS